MRKPIVFLFSGQGSHYYQMGQILFTHHATFRYWMQKAEQLFYAQTGLSVLTELYNPQRQYSDSFSRTLLTHPAIFMVQFACAQTLMAEGIQPALVLGTSLGEFAAAAIAGCLEFEDALQAVILQAQAIEQHCVPGSMVALLQSPQLYHLQSELHQYSELAAINFDKHFVISAASPVLDTLQPWLKSQQIAYQCLAVEHGFHSQFIDKAAASYLSQIKTLPIKAPALPIISCVSAKPIFTITSQYFWDIARQPILFQKAIQYLETQGHFDYIDVGPSGTLATFVKYNLTAESKSKALPTLTPFSKDDEAINRVKAALTI